MSRPPRTSSTPSDLQINKMVEKLKDYRPGTPEFKRLEQDVAQKQADFQVRGQLHKRDFMEREAAVYYKDLPGSDREHSLLRREPRHHAWCSAIAPIRLIRPIAIRCSAS